MRIYNKHIGIFTKVAVLFNKVYENNGNKGGVIVFNQEKRMIKWEKKRKLGAWKYIFIYGLLYFGGISFLPKLIQIYQGYDVFLSIIFHLFFIIPIGLTYGIFSWLVNEARYESYIENK